MGNLIPLPSFPSCGASLPPSPRQIIAEKALLILAKVNEDADPRGFMQGGVNPVSLASFLIMCAKDCGWVSGGRGGADVNPSPVLAPRNTLLDFAGPKP